MHLTSWKRARAASWIQVPQSISCLHTADDTHKRVQMLAPATTIPCFPPVLRTFCPPGKSNPKGLKVWIVVGAAENITRIYSSNTLETASFIFSDQRLLGQTITALVAGLKSLRWNAGQRLRLLFKNICECLLN